MDTEVIAAIIAVCGVLVSTFVSFLVGLWGKRENAKQVFAEVVSNNRLEWMNSIRTNISTFLSNAEILREMLKSQEYKQLLVANTDIYNEYIKFKRTMYEARELVVTRLNLDKELQGFMYVAIRGLDIESDDFLLQKDYIEDLARSILRPEWDSVKREAKGEE